MSVLSSQSTKRQSHAPCAYAYATYRGRWRRRLSAAAAMAAAARAVPVASPPPQPTTSPAGVRKRHQRHAAKAQPASACFDPIGWAAPSVPPAAAPVMCLFILFVGSRYEVQYPLRFCEHVSGLRQAASPNHEQAPSVTRPIEVAVCTWYRARCPLRFGIRYSRGGIRSIEARWMVKRAVGDVCSRCNLRVSSMQSNELRTNHGSDQSPLTWHTSNDSHDATGGRHRTAPAYYRGEPLPPTTGLSIVLVPAPRQGEAGRDRRPAASSNIGSRI